MLLVIAYFTKRSNMNAWKERGDVGRNPLIPLVAASEKVSNVKSGSLP